MHIRLANSIASIDFSNQSNIDALENIFVAARDGVHIISAERAVLNKIYSEAKTINERSKSFIKNQLNKYSQIGRLHEFIAPKIYVEGNIVDPQKAMATGSWHVGLLEFLNMRLVINNSLMSENINDCKLYMLAATHYSYKNKLNTFKVPAVTDLIGGGGDTTAASLKQQVDNKTSFCLCIVDSDKYYPSDTYGNTAQKCVDVFDSAKHWWVDLHILGAREIENKIPTKLLYQALPDQALQDKFTYIYDTFPRLNNLAWSFLDLKNGTTYKWLLGLSAPQGQEFWDSIKKGFKSPPTLIDCSAKKTCSNKLENVCQCKVVDGLGDSISDHFIKWSENQNHHKVVTQVCQTKDHKWLEIGKKVFEFLVGEQVYRL